MEHGSGALNVDAGRIGVEKRVPGSLPTNRDSKGVFGDYGLQDGSEDGHNPNIGRYPANLAFECICESVEVVDANDTGHFPTERTRGQGIYEFGGDTLPPAATPGGERRVQGKAIRHTNPDCPAYILDAQAGDLASGANPSERSTDKTRGIYGKFAGHECFPVRGADSGSASRFFYCAKSSRDEREQGLEGFEVRLFGQSGGAQQALADGETEYLQEGSVGLNSIKKVRNDHPCCKPIDLTRWLSSLLLPPDSVKPRRLLNPFAGSGAKQSERSLPDGMKWCALNKTAIIANWRRLASRIGRRLACSSMRKDDAGETVSTIKQPAQGGLF